MILKEYVGDRGPWFFSVEGGIVRDVTLGDFQISAKDFEAPGFILVAWEHFLQAGSIRSSPIGWYLPITGPRWIHRGELDRTRSFSQHPSEDSSGRYSRREIKQHLESNISKAKEFEFFRYEIITPHLFENGPDRRKAYLDRLAASRGNTA